MFKVAHRLMLFAMISMLEVFCFIFYEKYTFFILGPFFNILIYINLKSFIACVEDQLDNRRTLHVMLA